jgi:hypothetical protein
MGQSLAALKAAASSLGLCGADMLLPLGRLSRGYRMRSNVRGSYLPLCMVFLGVLCFGQAGDRYDTRA